MKTKGSTLLFSSIYVTLLKSCASSVAYIHSSFHFNTMLKVSIGMTMRNRTQFEWSCFLVSFPSKKSAYVNINNVGKEVSNMDVTNIGNIVGEALNL